MQRSFKERLAALEALEAEQAAADTGRRLEVFVQIRPGDYFALFEDTSTPEIERAAIAETYGLDRIDWAADRIQVMGGTWPNVPAAHERTIAHIVFPDGYGCRIDDAPWVDREPGQPHIHIATCAAVEALRRAQRERALAGFDLVIAALADGRAIVGATIYGCEPGGVYGPLSYGLCQMGDPEVLRWGMEVDRLMRAAGVTHPSTAEAYAVWIDENRRAMAEAL
jgi:hypothetical protein